LDGVGRFIEDPCEVALFFDEFIAAEFGEVDEG
jgi:hypothetical protein